MREIEEQGLSTDELLIHPDAVVIEDWMRKEEVESNLTARIASTGQGVGAAVAHRAFRDSSVKFASDHKEIRKYTQSNVNEVLSNALRAGERVLVEGTQGFGLSNIHGGHYPYATSRDTSAAGALSEAGLSPIDVDCIALVIRSYPIRVAGISGPLPKETDWESVTKDSGSNIGLSETTTVMGKIRRIAKFDATVVRRAIDVNNPTQICLNHVDYFDYSVHGQSTLSRKVIDCVREIEASINRPVDWIGTGPATTFSRIGHGLADVTAA